MSKVEITNIRHEVYGNCVNLQNGLIELLITTDFGPRIIHFSRVGKKNMFYQDPDRSTLGEAYDVFGGEGLVLYGGHRLWISPEIMPRCYYPDSKPVMCVHKENGMEFIAPVETPTGIQKTIAVTLCEDEPVVTVEHGIRNCGLWEIELAPWALTMLDAGAVEVIPMPRRKTGYLPNRSIVMWDYAAMNDPRVYWGDKYIVLKQDPSNAQPFKTGLENEAGWAAVFNHGQLLLKYFEPTEDGVYPDGGCNYETYTNDKFLESETLGVLEVLLPGEWAGHMEEWELYEEDEVPSCDEGEIARIISKHKV